MNKPSYCIEKVSFIDKSSKAGFAHAFSKHLSIYSVSRLTIIDFSRWIVTEFVLQEWCSHPWGEDTSKEIYCENKIWKGLRNIHKTRMKTVTWKVATLILFKSFANELVLIKKKWSEIVSKIVNIFILLKRKSFSTIVDLSSWHG